MAYNLSNNAQQWNVTVETSGTALIFKVYGEAGKNDPLTGHEIPPQLVKTLHMCNFSA